MSPIHKTGEILFSDVVLKRSEDGMLAAQIANEIKLIGGAEGILLWTAHLCSNWGSEANLSRVSRLLRPP